MVCSELNELFICQYSLPTVVIPCNRHLGLSRSPSFSSGSNERRRLSDAKVSLRNVLLSRSSLQSLSSDLQLLQDILEVGDNETWEDWNDEDFFEDDEECEDCKIRAEQTMLKGSLPPQVINGEFFVHSLVPLQGIPRSYMQQSDSTCYAGV